jgi:hypothetical protein
MGTLKLIQTNDCMFPTLFRHSPFFCSFFFSLPHLYLSTFPDCRIGPFFRQNSRQTGDLVTAPNRGNTNDPHSQSSIANRLAAVLVCKARKGC